MLSAVVRFGPRTERGRRAATAAVAQGPARADGTRAGCPEQQLAGRPWVLLDTGVWALEPGVFAARTGLPRHRRARSRLWRSNRARRAAATACGAVRGTIVPPQVTVCCRTMWATRWGETGTQAGGTGSVQARARVWETTAVTWQKLVTVCVSEETGEPLDDLAHRQGVRGCRALT